MYKYNSSKKFLIISPAILTITIAVFLILSGAIADQDEDAKKNHSRPMKLSRATFTGIEVPFVENMGQVDQAVAFYAPTMLGTVFVTRSGELVYSLNNADGGTVIRETWPQKTPEITKGDKAVSKISIFRREKRYSNLPSYNSIILKEIARNIDLHLKAYEGKVEKIFKVKPGGNPEDIIVTITGARKLEKKNGKLIVFTPTGSYQFSKPYVFQKTLTGEKEIKAEYVIIDDSHYSFKVASYDASRPLFIDPILEGSYIGGGEKSIENTSQWEIFNSGWGSGSGTDIAVTSDAVYVVGWTYPSFPVTPGAYDTTSNGKKDIFVAKFNRDLTSLIAATYLGGSDNDGTLYSDIIQHFLIIKIGPDGNVYVAGKTASKDFPTTYGAYDTDANGEYSDVDGFISKLSSDLTELLASTYIGGSGNDSINAIVFDENGDIYIGGYTQSNDFPTTYGAFQTELTGSKNGFIAKFDSDLTRLLASTEIGGSGNDEIKTLFYKNNRVYAAGWSYSYDFPVTNGAFMYANGDWEAFVTIFNNELTTVTASTFLGGSDGDGIHAIYVADNGDIYFGGWTESGDLPVTNAVQTDFGGGYYDVFAGIFNANLSKLEVLTYLGGNDTDTFEDLTVTPNGVVLVGWTRSTDFPTNGFDPTYNGDRYDGFITVYDLDFSRILASTYLGGNSEDKISSVEVDEDENIYVTGYSYSSNFPATDGAFDVTPNVSSDNNGAPHSIFISKLPFNLSSLLASTYLGGGDEDRLTSIAVDPYGYVYVAGWAYSYDFPTTDHSFTPVKPGNKDGIVTKFSPDLSTIIASTFVGGNGDDFINDITIYDGDVYLTGKTTSNNFPVSNSAATQDLNGLSDSFVMILAGTLDRMLHSTYLGGSGEEEGRSVIVTEDYVYIGGLTQSLDFPVTQGAAITVATDGYNGFIAKFSSDLSRIVSATYLGGTKWDIVNVIHVDSSGNIFAGGETESYDFPVTGDVFDNYLSGFSDAFIAKLNSDLSEILVATYLGGYGGESLFGMEMGKNGYLYVAGWTDSSSFPATEGAYDTSHNGAWSIDGFVAKIEADLSSIASATYIGGESDDDIRAMVLDKNDNVYVTGYTWSEDFPSTTGESFHGNYDGFLAVFSSDLSQLLASSYIGGSSDELFEGISLNQAGDIYIAGWTFSADIEVDGAKDYKGGVADGIVLKIPVSTLGNLPPEISSFEATPSSGLPPLTVTLKVTASDPDGEITSYKWDCEGDGTYEDETNNNTYQCTYNENGIFHPTVLVIDNAGSSAIASVTVYVGEEYINTPPVIYSFAATPQVGIAPLTVKFSLSVTDPDGYIKNIKWDFNGDGTIDKEGTSLIETFTYQNPSTYVVNVKVEDNENGVAERSILITVLSYSDNGDSEGSNISIGCSCNVGSGKTNYGDLLFFIIAAAFTLILRKKWQIE